MENVFLCNRIQNHSNSQQFGIFLDSTILYEEARTTCKVIRTATITYELTTYELLRFFFQSAQKFQIFGYISYNRNFFGVYDFSQTPCIFLSQDLRVIGRIREKRDINANQQNIGTRSFVRARTTPHRITAIVCKKPYNSQEIFSYSGYVALFLSTLLKARLVRYSQTCLRAIYDHITVLIGRFLVTS